jgi:hypothetical protein
MTDEIQKKVIGIFSGRSDKEQVKFYAGFNYVRLDRDNNGNKFNAAHLLKYSEGCHYLVHVMREVDGETVLYNYDVPSADLFKFIKSFEDSKLDGTIIELNKYFPEGLA